MNANKLTINFKPKNSSYCIFKPRVKYLSVNLDRGLLRYKETTKHLSPLLDRNLTWEHHVKEWNQN